MEMCRVCLSTEKEMFPLDEIFIISYNLLTNLNITLSDGMPQYSCKSCLDTVKYFVEFREKSIASETTLREVICTDFKAKTCVNECEPNPKEIISHKPSIDISDDVKIIKYEIKQENDDCFLDSFDVSFGDYDDEDIKNIVKAEDIKPKKLKRHKSRKNSGLNEINLNKVDEEWLCGVCPKIFCEKIELTKHLDDHKNMRHCQLCREELNSYSQLLAHRLVHVPIKQFRCHICDKKFKSCIYLEHHYRNIHIQGDDKKLKCKFCSRTCDTPKKYNSHMTHVHSNIEYICDICKKGFTNKANLKSHIKFHNGNKSYVCDICGYACKHSSGLKDHKIRIHAPDKVYCNTCKRPFLGQMEHDKHKCKIKLNVCPICGLQLVGNARLSRHMLVHSDIQKYECKRCPAKFKTRLALITHLNRHDGNRTKHCEYCPAKFYTANVLIKHRRTHTGEKPYVCKVCNKGFTGNHNLKVHMKVHGEYLIVKKNAEQDDVTIVPD